MTYFLTKLFRFYLFFSLSTVSIHNYFFAYVFSTKPLISSRTIVAGSPPDSIAFNQPAEERPFLLKISEIILWPQLVKLFVSSDEPLVFPGVQISAIYCTAVKNCKSLNYSLQPSILQSRGGLCGVDITPTIYSGAMTRLFLLPHFTDSSGKVVNEEPRGLVGTSTGLVFDLAGGCDGCISEATKPQIGSVLSISSSNIVKTSPTILAALHSHSQNYFHAINELLPRIHIVMDYINQRYDKDVGNFLVCTLADYGLMNSASEMMQWGLSATERGSGNGKAFIKLKKKKGSDAFGSFFHPTQSGVVEATAHIIVSAPVSKEWNELLHSARACVGQKLRSYTIPDWADVCEPFELPKGPYIVVIAEDFHAERKIINSDALVSFIQKNFDLPLVVPKVDEGCDFFDYVRFFSNAVGFIAVHDLVFTNVNFMAAPGVVVQIIPEKPFPFSGQVLMYEAEIKSLGHKYVALTGMSTKAPSWDVEYTDSMILKKFCSPTEGIVYPFLDVWKPKQEMFDACAAYAKSGVA